MPISKWRVLIIDDSSANRSADIYFAHTTYSNLVNGVPFSSPCRKIVRRMLERKENVAVLGEISVMEVDDGITGLDVMRTELAALFAGGLHHDQYERSRGRAEGEGITGNALP